MLRPDISSTSSVNAVALGKAGVLCFWPAAAAAERGRPENAQHWPQSGAGSLMCGWCAAAGRYVGEQIQKESVAIETAGMTIIRKVRARPSLSLLSRAGQTWLD